MEKTIEIPEGYEARIEGNKVILERKESEDERIRKEIIEFIDLAASRHSIRNDWFQKKRPAEWITYLERQKEQKPEEWSEEDEKMRVSIVMTLAGFMGNEEKISWLKSLRPQPITYVLDEPLGYDNDHNPIYPPINHWKPSKEQMEALMLAIEGKWEAIKPTGYMSRRLEDLYDGLANTFKVECKLDE